MDVSMSEAPRRVDRYYHPQYVGLEPWALPCHDDERVQPVGIVEAAAAQTSVTSRRDNSWRSGSMPTSSEIQLIRDSPGLRVHCVRTDTR